MTEERENDVKGQGYLIFLCWLVYLISYVSRYSYNSNMNPIMSEFGIDKATAGLVATFYYFAYGAGQIINGLLCKRYNKRIMISASLLVSSIVNIIFFMGIDFRFAKYLWFINGAALSILWSSLISVLGEYLSKNKISISAIVMSTPIVIGTAVSYGTSALFVYIGNYRLSFLLGFIVAAAVAVMWFFSFGRYKKTHEKSLENEEPTVTPENKGNIIKGNKKSVVLMLVIMCVFAVVCNLIKDGLQNWTPTILKESYGLSDSLSIVLSIALPALGVFSAALCVFMQKKIKNPIIVNIILFSLIGLLIAGLTFAFRTPFWVLVLSIFGVITLFIHTVNNSLTSVTPLFMRDKIDPGFMAGFVNGFCYVGSTISAYGLGLIADAGGWESVFTVFLSACGVVFILGLIAFFVLKRAGAKVDV